MRILDMLKKKAFIAPAQLTFDENEREGWPRQAIAHFGLDGEFATFAKEISDITDRIRETLRKFTDEGILSAIPDRARTMNALHGNEYANQTQKLLKSVAFSDLMTFDRQQDAFFEASSAYKDQIAKNASVLKEFMHEELHATQSLLQQLEDRVIAFAKVLEERKYSQIKKITDVNARIRQLDERTDKYAKLMQSLQGDLKRTQDRRSKLDEDIKSQTALVRNQESLAALERIRRIEEEMHKLAVQYASVCSDVRTVYKKHPDYKLAQNIKVVLDDLPKDPLNYISSRSDFIKKAFEDIIAQFEEEQPGNIRGILERLTKCIAAVEQDARRIVTSAPDQRSLKKEMMRDIAALNIYDKRQFLLRAQTEEETITTKINFLTQELDPAKKVTLEREAKDAAIALGATLRQAEQE
jgi:hypothetical protein